MKVESIAECSLWSILQYFWPALSDELSWTPIFGLFWVAALDRFYCTCMVYELFLRYQTFHELLLVGHTSRWSTVGINKCGLSCLILILYIPVNSFSAMSGRVFLGWTSSKQVWMCLAQGHNTVTPVRFKSVTPQSGVKHSTTEPLCSQVAFHQG